MTVTPDIESERAALTKSLAQRPSAPTACADWKSLDLAVHLISEERSGGVVVFNGRSLAIRGIPIFGSFVASGGSPPSVGCRCLNL